MRRMATRNMNLGFVDSGLGGSCVWEWCKGSPVPGV